MTIAKVQELRNKRAGLVKEARGILERETTEKRSLAADELEHYDKIMKEVDSLRSQIEREERLVGIEGEFTQRNTTPVIDDEPEDRSGPRATKEYRNSFWNVLKEGRNADPREMRDLFKAEDAKGGYLAPEEFETTLLRELTKATVMRQLATVMQSSTDRKIPMVADRPKFNYIAEKGTYGKTSMSFAVQHMGAHKGGGILLISEELMQDASFNLEAEIRSQFVEAESELEEHSFLLGDGDEKPRGLLLDAKQGVEATTDGVTADNLIDLFYSVKRGYRQRGTFLMGDSSIKAIRKMKRTGDNDYLWQPGLQAGEPDRILGRPVTTSDFMPEIGAGAKSVAFGDIGRYRIMDRLGIAIQRLDELYAETGQVGFRATFRHDGKLLVPEAVKTITHAGE
ncbi:phage major capsid protein [Sporosarcina sp. FSL W7-1283]|uniref:phage major capsid protein n=1 Tax=Sporosarcina sp. FSL W7-1283 TaxID=2921560 RepID=UPI0030F78403